MPRPIELGDMSRVLWPSQFRRNAKEPLEYGLLFPTVSAMEAYVRGDATAYVGQLVSVAGGSDGTGVYQILSTGTDGTYVRLSMIQPEISVTLSRPDGTVADGELLTATFALLDAGGVAVPSGSYRLDLTRQSGDGVSDAAWNAALATAYPDGLPAAIDFTTAAVPEQGAVFVVRSRRSVGGEEYSTTAAFTLSRAYAQEDFRGSWDAAATYSRTPRFYPTVTYGGCKWWLKASTSTGDEPSPTSAVWGMVYGVDSLEIRFYNASGQWLHSAVAWPGHVDLTVEPHLLCGSFDITSELTDADWTWSRYSGTYGEATDSRSLAEQQSDLGWPTAHWSGVAMGRTLHITNSDMPPTWGSGQTVTFIVTADYGGLTLTNIVTV